MITIGHPIEDFEVKAYDPRKDRFVTVKSEEYRGRWVLLVFYPADFTFVCPTELEDLADHYDAFNALGAEVMSISTDTEFVHKAWHDHSEAIKKVPFLMLADPTGNVCREFGVYLDQEGLALRGTFVIDPDGVLKTIEIHDNAIGRSAKELLRKLQAAKFVREHKGNVCPASWEPEGKTLEPGIDLVGKI
ncbi:MAG: redoxin domain-containing protein [Patescibacteria group bacterium]|nr:redoxin domain-containing protein [Patescibacteria group bacterium]MDE2437935.1 redoxin domain-containing protein [Patescibacteria group bacterium]